MGSVSNFGSSFDRVKKALEDKVEGRFDPKKYKNMENDIWVLNERLKKVQQMAPEFADIGFSDEMLKLVGKKQIIVSFFGNNAEVAKKGKKAASLL